jgi:hypothetical protein
MNWKKWTISRALNISNGSGTQLLPTQRIFWTSHFLTDQAWFHISGYANYQNSHVWSPINSHEIKETSLHDQRGGVWCAISRNWITGLEFFNGTINFKCYCEVKFFNASLDI